MSIRTLASRVVYSEAVQRTAVGYRFALTRRYGHARPFGAPHAPWRNAVLQTRREWEDATAQVEALGLLSNPTRSKNWDGLAALACILERIDRSSPVLDAGAAEYSKLLTWLFMYGYTRLFGINVEFDRAWKRGSIRYEPGDLTNTRFKPGAFGAVVCQSVLEHGVDVGAYLREMARILRPGGLLMTSVDYFDEPIDTRGMMPAGGPSYHLFNRTDIERLLSTAASLGLTPTDPIDLRCQDRPIAWTTYGLECTYLMMTLRKT